MSVDRTAYEALLDRVEKPGRYLGNERGMVRKDPAAVALRFALAFPDVYEIAQSHPGLQILYDLLNRRADVYAEFWTHEDPIRAWERKRRRWAEVLVPDRVAPGLIIGTFVSCDDAREALTSLRANVPIEVNPHLFFRA